MRNTFPEFLRLSQQSPRPHAATYFGSLLTQKGVRNPFGSLTPLSVLFNANIMSLSFYFVNSFLLFFFCFSFLPCFSTDFFHYPYNITISKFYSPSPVECIISDYFQFFHKCRDCPHLIRLQILLSIDRFFQNLTYAKICTCLYSLIFFMNFLIYFTGFPSKAHRYSEKSRQFLHFF